MNEYDIARHSLSIDPQLHIWGWEIPVYLFLGGMAAGLMILTALLSARKGERSPAARWLAFGPPALVSVGMGALFLDLSNKAHVWRFYLAFRWTSPMSWGAWILVVMIPLSLTLALAGLTDGEAARVEGVLQRLGLAAPARALRDLGRRRLAYLCRANLLVGAGLGVYTGILLSALGARALWSSALLGPLFLVSGLSTGAAFLLLFRLSDEERHLVTRWDMIAIGLEVAVLLLFLVGLASGGAAGREAAGLILGGPWTAQFWSLVVIAGLAMPLSLEILEARLGLKATAVAPALVLLGGLALRWIMVAAGQV